MCVSCLQDLNIACSLMDVCDGNMEVFSFPVGGGAPFRREM